MHVLPIPLNNNRKTMHSTEGYPTLAVGPLLRHGHCSQFHFFLEICSCVGSPPLLFFPSGADFPCLCSVLPLALFTLKFCVRHRVRPRAFCGWLMFPGTRVSLPVAVQAFLVFSPPDRAAPPCECSSGCPSGGGPGAPSCVPSISARSVRACLSRGAPLCALHLPVSKGS